MSECRLKHRAKIRLRLHHYIGIVLAVLFAYAVFIEPNIVEVKQVDVTIPTLPRAFDGYTIAVISDTHSRYLASIAPLARAVRIINAHHPDAVTLLGDYSTTTAERADDCAKILARLQAVDGVYAIMGNHDQLYSSRIAHELTASGRITLLVNQSRLIQLNGQHLWIAGLADLYSGKTDIRVALHGISIREPIILLMHEPIFANEAQHYPISLQLSGHSHGGQIRIPFCGAAHYPAFVGRYHAGLYHAGHLQVYVNRGLGTTGPPMRFCCPPEITIIHLRSTRPVNPHDRY